MRLFFLAFLVALLVGAPITGAAAHDGWFVRVCSAKTEANRIHLIFSGGRQLPIGVCLLPIGSVHRTTALFIDPREYVRPRIVKERQ